VLTKKRVLLAGVVTTVLVFLIVGSTAVGITLTTLEVSQDMKKYWFNTNCSVTNLKTQRESGKYTNYRAIFEVSFVDSQGVFKEHKAAVIFTESAGYTSNWKDVQSQMALYPVGKSVGCFVNPLGEDYDDVSNHANLHSLSLLNYSQSQLDSFVQKYWGVFGTGLASFGIAGIILLAVVVRFICTRKRFTKPFSKYQPLA